jgi:hypothetical protein
MPMSLLRTHKILGLIRIYIFSFKKKILKKYFQLLNFFLRIKKRNLMKKINAKNEGTIFFKILNNLEKKDLSILIDFELQGGLSLK